MEAVENGLVVGQEKEEYLQNAYERAGALRSFVEKLFEWVKLDAGEQKLQIEPLDLCEISRQYVAEWIGPLESSGFSYTIEIPEETWLADLDKNAYKRIVTNLCENVLRHSHGTQFRFCLVPDARQAMIRISDNGTGISADDLPHVFDRLYQCDPSRTTPGNGLGLSITKELVVAMGGAIQVQSSPDHETTFTICFPKAKALP